MCFSSHSAANGVIASAVNLRAISWIWSWSSVRSNWLISRALYGAGRLSARRTVRLLGVGAGVVQVRPVDAVLELVRRGHAALVRRECLHVGIALDAAGKS